MLKKPFLWIIFFFFVFLVSGCTLVKGTGGAAVGFVQGAREGANQGVKDDCNSIQKADTWVKDNLW